MGVFERVAERLGASLTAARHAKSERKGETNDHCPQCGHRSHQDTCDCTSEACECYQRRYVDEIYCTFCMYEPTEDEPALLGEQGGKYPDFPAFLEHCDDLHHEHDAHHTASWNARTFLALRKTPWA